MLHVFVNGTQVLRDGEHTGEICPDECVRGPGWVGGMTQPNRSLLRIDKGSGSRSHQTPIYWVVRRLAQAMI